MFREPNVSELRCKPSHQGVAWAFTFWRNITIVFVSTGDAGWVLIYIRTSNKALKAPGAFACLCCSQKSGSLRFNAISKVLVHSGILLHRWEGFTPSVCYIIISGLVPLRGIEPLSPFRRQILSLLCLPFHHRGGSLTM